MNCQRRVLRVLTLSDIMLHIQAVHQPAAGVYVVEPAFLGQYPALERSLFEIHTVECAVQASTSNRWKDQKIHARALIFPIQGTVFKS